MAFRTFSLSSFIVLLCINVTKGCYSNTDCSYTYTDEEDVCFMKAMYPSQQNEAFCFGGSWPSSGSCEKKKSYLEECLNADNHDDNNYCVTNFCSSATNTCEYRSEARSCVIDPTSSPTQKPTKAPTPKPTPEPTPNPTVSPTPKPSFDPTAPTKPPHTLDPTHNPTNATVATSDGKKEFIDPTLAFSGATLICVCIIAIIIASIARRNRKTKMKTANSELSLPLLKQSMKELLDEEKEHEMLIKKAMVILLAIGEYDEKPTHADEELEHGLKNLNGVDLDIRHLLKLFGPNNLNYTIYPQYDLDKKMKLHWTEKEIVALIKERAVYLEKNMNKFDGLIVVISGHGLAGNICTSDCKLIEKLAIHRAFSQNHPLLRDLPRIFMFDCCDGEYDYSKGRKSHKVKKESKDKTKARTGSLDQGKRYSLLDIEDETTEPLWTKDQNNPDHRLVEINAANPGFQSKLKMNEGSYMLTEFVERSISNLNKQQHEFVYKMFDVIQHELAVNKRKQQITTIYNDRTRYIKLMPNKN